MVRTTTREVVEKVHTTELSAALHMEDTKTVLVGNAEDPIPRSAVETVVRHMEYPQMLSDRENGWEIAPRRDDECVTFNTENHSQTAIRDDVIEMVELADEYFGGE